MLSHRIKGIICIPSPCSARPIYDYASQKALCNAPAALSRTGVSPRGCQALLHSGQPQHIDYSGDASGRRRERMLESECPVAVGHEQLRGSATNCGDTWCLVWSLRLSSHVAVSASQFSFGLLKCKFLVFPDFRENSKTLKVQNANKLQM